MRYVAAAALAALLMAGAASGQSVSITGPNRGAMLEGETYTITWESNGIQSVSVVAHGERTARGTQSRGNFSYAVAEAVPAGEGRAEWQVPWVDSRSLFIKLKGYDRAGEVVATAERGYGFRPAVLANRTEDGIYLDLSRRSNQRLYVQRDYRITRAYITTSSENYEWRPPCNHVRRAHDHAGVFSVIEKKRSHYSELFEVEMPWAMRYHRGHFVHATSPNLYRDLGEPSSGGCNRLTDHDARELYIMTSIGTRVEVIGPDG